MDTMVTAEPDTIKIGDFIIIQRQKYTKLHKLTAMSSPTLGREVLTGIIDDPEHRIDPPLF